MLDEEKIRKLFEESLERRKRLSLSQKIFNVLGILFVFFLANWGIAWYAQSRLQSLDMDKEEYLEMISSNNSVVVERWQMQEDKKYWKEIAEKIIGKKTYVVLARNKTLSVVGFLFLCYLILYGIARLRGFTTLGFLSIVIKKVFTLKGLILGILIYSTIPLNNYIEELAARHPETPIAKLNTNKLILLAYILLVLVAQMFFSKYFEIFKSNSFKNKNTRIKIFTVIATLILIFIIAYNKESISAYLAPRAWDIVNAYVNFYENLGLL